MKPSLIALALSGLLIFIALLQYINYYDKIKEVQKINLYLFFASAISFHGLLHMGAEIFYDFNPLEGKIKFNK